MEKLGSITAERCKLLALQWLMPVRLLFVMLISLVAFAGLPNAEAQPVTAPEVTERQVKAAYLSKFGSYVEWPAQAFASPESPINIGVIGADVLAEDLTQILAGRTVNGREVRVQKLRYGDSIAGLNVLFIGRSNNHRLGEILAMTKGTPILTVTESEQALALGSMINFVIINGRVRFEVSPKAAGLGNLYISARLLAAAHKVVPETS